MPQLNDVQNLSVVGDVLTFDAVPDATGYEIRLAKSFQSTVSESQLIEIVSNNDPLSVPNSAGFRFFARALAEDNAKSANFSSFWVPFLTSPCGPSEPPKILDKLMIFYVDWATGEIVDENATTTPSGEIGIITRSVIPINSIITPNGDGLENYYILSAEAEGFINKNYVIDNEGWHTLTMWDNFGDFDEHRGSFSGIYKGNLVVQTLYSDVLHLRTRYFPHLAGQINYADYTATPTMACRFKIIALRKI